MIVVGIDPGLTGAIATSHGHVYDIPVVMKGKGQGSVKKHIDPKGVYQILREIITYTTNDGLANNDILVYLEEQYYRKKFGFNKKEIPQGGSSIFSLGDSYGVIRAAIAIADLTCVTVSPSTWKKRLNLTSDKEMCRAKAIEWWPKSHEYLSRKKDHNRAEALLLVKYGIMNQLGQL